MRQLTFCLAVLLLCLHTLGYGQQKNAWINLFNGQSTESLRGYQMNSFPAQSWIVEDSALVAQTGVPNIDLVTKETYKDFGTESGLESIRSG